MQPNQFGRAGIFDRAIDAFAASEDANLPRGVGAVCIHDQVGAQFFQRIRFARKARRGNDAAAGELGEHQCRRAHAAGGAGDQQRVAFVRVDPCGNHVMRGGASRHRRGGSIDVERRRGLEPVILRTRGVLRIAAEHRVPRQVDAGRQVAEAALRLGRVRIFRAGEPDDAVAGFEAADLGADRLDDAGHVAAELHRHRKRLAAGDAATMAGGLAVEFMHLAAAVFHVPARHRGCEHLHQHAAFAHLRHRAIAVDELVRAAELEQTHGFHVGSPSHPGDLR